jgi:thermitase
MTASLLIGMLSFSSSIEISRADSENLTVSAGHVPDCQKTKIEQRRSRSLPDEEFAVLRMLGDANSSEEDLREFNRSVDGYDKLTVGVVMQGTWLRKLEELISKEGGSITNTISTAKQVKAFVVKVPTDQVSVFIEKLRTSQLVKYVEPEAKMEAFYTPNDPDWSQQWGPRKIEADTAWNTTAGSSDVLVAVVDTGIDYTHADLAANYVPLGYDWANNDTDPMDDNGHGTHCAGIIAAKIDNGLGIAGLAQAHIMAEKVLDFTGRGSDSSVAQGIIHATDQGAKIISMSLGSPEDSEVLRDAVQYAYDHGVLIIAAAGNSYNDDRHYPAAYDEVIAVSATEMDDSRAYFSTFGHWVDIAAPGIDIYSTLPGNSYGNESGTSMACPHVAGVAALAWSTYTNCNANQIRWVLEHTLDEFDYEGFDSMYYALGRVNARKAVGLLQHDLRISEWQHPYRVDPGQPGKFNATITNYGTRNETNISVRFLVNGTLTDSMNIDSLNAFSSPRTVSFSWSTTTVGNYNATCYVFPVPDENSTEDNMAYGNVSVRFPVAFHVPSEYPTIKAAVNVACEGDTVSVSEGYYVENQITILRDDVTLVGNGNPILNGGEAHYVLSVWANFATIKGLTIMNCSNIGVRMRGYRNTITENNFTDSGSNMYVYASSECTINLNNLTAHEAVYAGGMFFRFCSNCTISQNIVAGDSEFGGMYIRDSSNNTISLNVVAGGIQGTALQIDRSQNNLITSNNITSNLCGLILWLATNNVLRNNIMTNNTVNFGVQKNILENSWQTINDVDTSNTVDGKPIYYWVNAYDKAVPSNAGCVVLVQCRNITIENLDLRHNLDGIFLIETNGTIIRGNSIMANGESDTLLCGGITAYYDCSNTTITLNTLADNENGIVFAQYRHNVTLANVTVTHNNIVSNRDYGVYLAHSENATIGKLYLQRQYQKLRRVPCALGECYCDLKQYSFKRHSL